MSELRPSQLIRYSYLPIRHLSFPIFFFSMSMSHALSLNSQKRNSDRTLCVPVYVTVYCPYLQTRRNGSRRGTSHGTAWSRTWTTSPWVVDVIPRGAMRTRRRPLSPVSGTRSRRRCRRTASRPAATSAVHALREPWRRRWAGAGGPCAGPS